MIFEKENADSLEVTFKFLAPTVPSFEYKVTYIAYFDGRLGVKAEYDGVKGPICQYSQWISK